MIQRERVQRELLHVHRTQMQTLAVADDDQPDRYCYGCRARRPHSWKLVGDPQPSYYGPTPKIVCTGCGDDRTFFPGCWPDGPRAPSDEVWAALIADRSARRGETM